MSLPATLSFQPLFRDYLWGGNRLRSHLRKPTGPGIWAESWEIVDHPDAQSIVAAGNWQGQSLSELTRRFGEQLVGRSVWQRIRDASVPESLRGRFPLLLKFLDAAQNLSVQVHPDDERAKNLTPPDLGKTEAWYVIDSDPGARIYSGLQPGVTPSQLEAGIAAGNVSALLHSFTPRPGDCVFIPAGTVHAIGAGVLILEIQQSSNTTWRVFDWDRVDKNGQRRKLHVDQAVRAIDFATGPVDPVGPVEESPAGCAMLVDCEYFKLKRWQNVAGSFALGGDGEMRIIAVTGGSFLMETCDGSERLAIGDTRLIPAASEAVTLHPEAGEYESVLIEISCNE